MQQIADWLKTLGMSEYAQRFADNDLDFTILGDLTDQDLEKIGVASLGHRRKLLRAIADLKGVGKSEPRVALRLQHPPGRARRTPQMRDLVFTISLKRSTQNLQLSTSSPADYPIYWPFSTFGAVQCYVRS